MTNETLIALLDGDIRATAKMVRRATRMFLKRELTISEVYDIMEVHDATIDVRSAKISDELRKIKTAYLDSPAEAEAEVIEDIAGFDIGETLGDIMAAQFASLRGGASKAGRQRDTI